MTTNVLHQSHWPIVALLLASLALPACNLHESVDPVVSGDTATITDTGGDPPEDDTSREETGVDADGGDTGDTRGPDAETCVPKTCADVGESCGELDDGCGGTIDCGCSGSRVAKCQGVPCACSRDKTCELSYTAVLVKDVSRRIDPDLCIDRGQPGSDIFGATLKRSGEQDIPGQLVGKNLNARRFNNYRTLITDVLPATCPREQTAGDVMSLGCGGWVAFNFKEGPTALTIDSADEIVIGEWGNRCDDDCQNAQECGFDTYEVRLCTGPPEMIAQGDISSCRVLAGGLGGTDAYKGREIQTARPPSDPLIQDTDNDGVPNRMDNCPSESNQDQKNQDTDPFGDACDNCPGTDNPDQTDSYGNGRGDKCEYECDTMDRTSCPKGEACRVVEHSQRAEILSCYSTGSTATEDSCDGLLDQCHSGAQCLEVNETGARKCLKFCSVSSDCPSGETCQNLKDSIHGEVMVCQIDS